MMAKQHFKFDFEKWMIRELLEGNREADEWYDAMCEILPLWDINTIERVAGFIAQCGHESRNFTVLSENMNYSASRLNVIFPKYFVRAGRDAQAYHRQPERIANIVYANRLGNGDSASGDGWRFRGGGLIQLTGRHNYTEFGKSVKMSAEQAVDYVRTKKGALDSACWFWDTNNINTYCDRQDIRGMTRRINGGTNGLEERNHMWIRALDVLGGEADLSEDLNVQTTLRMGSRGPAVAQMQQALGIAADGIYGAGTARAVRRFQSANGLTVDGIAGPVTLKKLLG